MSLIAVVFVDEVIGIAHRTRTCRARGLVKYLELGVGDDMFRWLYRPQRPGVQPTLLTDWRECEACVGRCHEGTA